MYQLVNGDFHPTRHWRNIPPAITLDSVRYPVDGLWFSRGNFHRNCSIRIMHHSEVGDKDPVRFGICYRRNQALGELSRKLVPTGEMRFQLGDQ
jgi:hypothetical protein